NLTFNAYNLDPFVWFVHEKLGLSAYGFALDDDTADVGAPGATNLQVSIGGTKGLPNKNPRTLVAPFGPVKAPGTVISIQTNSGPTTVIQFSGKDAYVVSSQLLGGGGALVIGPSGPTTGIPPGSTIGPVSIPPVLNDPNAQSNVPVPGLTLTVGQSGDYYLFGPVVATGTVAPGALTITGIKKAIGDTLTMLPLQNNDGSYTLLVDGPGIQAGTMVKKVTPVVVNGKTVYTVTLTKPLGTPLTKS